MAFWEISIITLSECVNLIWKRLCVSVFDSSPMQPAMLTLVEEDRSALLWEKAYGKTALQHSVELSPRVAVCSCNTCKHTCSNVSHGQSNKKVYFQVSSVVLVCKSTRIQLLELGIILAI